MMTQSIPTRASGNLFGAVGSAAYLAKRSRENCFDMVLAGSIKRDTKISTKAKKVNENTKNIPSTNKNQATNDNEKAKGIKQDVKTMKFAEGTENTQTVDNGRRQEQKSEDNSSLDLFGQIMTMLEQINNAIMQELDLTPDELDSMMKELGLELSDLTDPQAIISLVLADSGNINPFVMLMDEQLTSKFQGLLTKLEDIKGEANLQLTDDEIKQIFEQIMMSEEDQALVDSNEAQAVQPQHVSKEAENESGKADKDTNRLQAVSEHDSQTDDQRPVIASSSDDSQLSDTKDQRSKTDRTDGFENFLDKLSANYDKPVVDFNTVRIDDIREIAQQIIEQIRVIIKPEQTTMELQLNPEHLGKVNLTISSKEGLMTAHFVVQNDITKEAIESQLITLKDTLAQQGIKVETIDVAVASYTFDQKDSSDDAEQSTHKKQRNGHKITFEEAVAMSEEPIEEDIITNLTGAMGYNIDYTA